ERDTKTVTLTKAGEEFLKYAKNIKKEVDKALIAMNHINSNNEITIGFPSTLLLYNMSRYNTIMKELETNLNQYSFIPVIIDGEDKTPSLQNGQCDLVITKLLKELPKCYDYDIIMDQHISYVITSINSEISDKEKLNLKDIENYDVFIISNDTSFNPGIEKQLNKNHTIKHYPTYETAIPQISRNRGIAITYENTNYGNGTKTIPIELFDEYKIACVYKKDNPVLKKVSRIIQQVHLDLE
ncbi:MAG: hypothetical protein ACI4WM_06865, partial [Erysipelotrichaceae bacterium]